MRIVAGTRKGQRLEVPAGVAVRPTPGRVREAAMSILGGFFDGERVLDLCAGSGSMGIEWLSRGAGLVVFCEPDADARRALCANLARGQFGDAARVLALDGASALARLGREGARFDFVWVDPPWDAGLAGPLLAALVERGVLATGAEIWVESRGGLRPDEVPAGLHAFDRRIYGNVVVDRLRPTAEGAP
jgi:16S rRNA (guanine966-N2)-methyltransferase